MEVGWEALTSCLFAKKLDTGESREGQNEVVIVTTDFLDLHSSFHYPWADKTWVTSASPCFAESGPGTLEVLSRIDSRPQ